MRTAFVCLLSLVLSVSIAHAAPAPLPKDRDPDRFPSARAVEEYLREHHQLEVIDLSARGKCHWIVVGRSSPLHYWRRSRVQQLQERVYLVKYQGKDLEGRRQFAVVDLEEARRNGH